MPRALDLVASRKLSFAAGISGVTAIVLREGAEAVPSAALTRWQISSAPSSDKDAWGSPRFTAELTRNRLGPTGRWRNDMEP